MICIRYFSVHSAEPDYPASAESPPESVPGVDFGYYNSRIRPQVAVLQVIWVLLQSTQGRFREWQSICVYRTDGRTRRQVHAGKLDKSEPDSWVWPRRTWEPHSDWHTARDMGGDGSVRSFSLKDDCCCSIMGTNLWKKRQICLLWSQ